MSEAPAAEARPRRRYRWILRITVACLVLAMLAGVAGVFAGYLVYDRVTRPGVAGEPVKFRIPEGATGRDVARLMQEKDLVEHEALLRIALRLEPDGDIKHGFYVLPKGLSAKEVLAKLREGPNRGPDPDEIPPELRVTVPEGLSIAQASELFDEPQAFVAAASDPALVAKLGVKVPNLEGFLLPSTYFFEEKPSERDVVERMLEQFRKEHEKLLKEYPEAAGQDLVRLVTVASLVEEEARVDEERPLIAAVVYNRLKKNMPLGFDATLQFALNKYGERLLDKDKAVDSPYNTYLNVGLPPGPICSPGLKSLRAALEPAETDYLFFVSNADGKTHTFSRTMAEHERAVIEYRKKIAPQRREERVERQEAG